MHSDVSSCPFSKEAPLEARLMEPMVIDLLSRTEKAISEGLDLFRRPILLQGHSVLGQSRRSHLLETVHELIYKCGAGIDGVDEDSQRLRLRPGG